ncbi:MAG: hypothetical protein GY859_19225, partial [Desulfobacterales bacterium]|nr:hypothetical protein [Desulfobacterales bacterium]
MTGQYELSLAGAFAAGDQATTLRDYDQNTYTNAGMVTTLGTGADNNLCEVEAALSKNPVDMYYTSSVAVNWVTFPTKLSVINSSCAYSTPFVRGMFDAWQDEPYIVEYSPKYWDMQENTPGGTETHFSPFTATPDKSFLGEVNFLFTQPEFVAAAYDEGWIRYDMTYTTTCPPSGSATEGVRYTGAPAIAWSWVSGANGVYIAPAWHTNGAVSYCDDTTADPQVWTLVPYYQYTNGAYDAAILGEFETPAP